MEKELDGESTCAAPCEKKRLIPSCFEWGTVPATKKMKTEEDLEVLLAYPSLGEGKKKKKVVVKRLGKEENSAVTIRQRQDVIRAQFEAKGYVHVLAEADDDSDTDQEMHPL
ncbi:hypothetical protein OsJ_32775 [Oryza sativa Japonica Group]|uniref:Uncharacterized protein n=1 Tax=Oryza sativa subsp. japonica TaxID=39947 RepID=A3C841_ORYSJ|nr:hypothetical protein OsJ_32775 [Oryza sativa Japonica Group]